MLKFCQGYNGGQHRVSDFNAKALSSQTKSSYDKRIMKSTKLQKDPKHGFGMVITCGNTYETILHGAFIESVYPGSPADKDSNISPGDQILSVNGTNVQNDHFLTVVDLLQYSTGPVEIVVAKSNSKSQDLSKKEITEKPFVKSKVWVVGDEEISSVTSLENKKAEPEKMPIPQPRKKWLETQDKPVNFDVPDLTINHTSNLISDQSWMKESACNKINGQQLTRDNIPDIIASQMIKYESETVSSSPVEMDRGEDLEELNDNENTLLPGEIFHVVLDKRGGSLGLNIYQGTESTNSEQRHIYIHSIIPNGAADLDSRIKPGDKLLEVNGTLLENLSYQEVVGKLRESPQVAHLVLEKGCVAETDSSNSESKFSSSTNIFKQVENTPTPRITAVEKWFEFSSSNNKGHSFNVNSIPESDYECSSEDHSFLSLPTDVEAANSSYMCAKNATLPLSYNIMDSSKLSGIPSMKSSEESRSSNYSLPSHHLAKAHEMRSPNNNREFRSKLTSFSSTPNLAENSDEEENQTGFGSLYRNRSTDCLASPHFSNPHQALFDIYRNFSYVRGSNKMRSIPAVPIRRKKLKKLQDIYDYSNPDNTFKVSIRKSSRGLGLSICGGTGVPGRDIFSQLIRIRQLYPLQPAIECGKLQLGDVILSVNGTNMVGLTNTEALEVLRTTSTDVVLEVFRPTKSFIPSYSTFKEGVWPFCDSSSSSASSSLSRSENAYNVETGEFEVTLIKRGGSLGFSITRNEPESSDEGIFVKALVREPAISDGRIQPGDKIVQVNGVTISSMTHAEAIEFIRQTPNEVTLKLHRSDQPLTPGYSDKENPITKPLRWEAKELLIGRQKDKESGDESSSLSKRRMKRKLDRLSNATSNSSSSSSSNGSSCSSGQEHIIEENPESDPTEDMSLETSGLQRNLRPKSLDALNSSDRKRLPQYVAEESFHRQSSVMCTNVESKSNEKDSTDGSAKKGGENLLKWRGSTLPHTEEDAGPDVIHQTKVSVSSNSNDQTSIDSASDDEKPVPFPRTTSRLTEWVHTFDVDLDRGWHGRLGFSLCDPPPTAPESPRSLLPIAPEVKAVHSGSLADKDGRIKAGDRLVEANRECLLRKSAVEVIDILRKTRGVIRMVFCRLETR